MTRSSAPLAVDSTLTGAGTSVTSRKALAWIGFPETVDENSARLVATGVVVLGCTVLAGGSFVVVLMALGFLARVLSGPRFSPLALLVTRVVVPTFGLQGRQVAGSPKRFAQGIGLGFTTAGSAAWILGYQGVLTALMVGLVGAALLEAALGFCVGCKIYGLLQRAGWIDESACADCADITRRTLG